MGKLKKITYSLKDVAVVQAPVSYTNHRSEVDPKIKICGRKSYPIFVAPMASVTDENNYKVWIKNGLTPVVPRSVQQRLSFEERMDIATKTFVSVSLAEAENELYQYLSKEPIAIYYICIDIAHGTLNRLYNICKKLKSEFYDRCVIMTGNIANPKAYSFYADAGVDYVRCSVGTGCFTPNMLVVTKDGLKKISDIKIGDEVLTHTGEYHKVTHTHEFYKKEKLMKINDIECTTNHKFYVVNKTDIENINEDNISEYAYWVSANELDKKKHLLVKK